MDLVIDANILFAALVREGKTTELLFKHRLYAPDFILYEFRKYRRYLKHKTKRSAEEFEHLFEILERNIVLVQKKEMEHFFITAEAISPDKKDTIYLALALKLKCSLWTNDKALKLQNLVKIYSTEDLILLDEATT